MHAQLDARSEPESVELRAHCLRREVGGDALTRSPGFTLTVSNGETIFLVGPSGCGKTSILRCLSLLDGLESGSLELNRQPAREWSVPRWRTLVRYVHQQRIAFEGTPRQLYDAWSSLHSQRSREHRPIEPLFADLGLEPALLDQEYSTLSGGQYQRAQIAISVALNPRILLLDEPTASLDPESVQRVEALLRRWGGSIVWVSHDPEQVVRFGGRVVDLSHRHPSRGSI